MLLLLLILGTLPVSTANEFTFPTTIGGAISDWVLTAGVEMEVWSHNITSMSGLQYGAYLNHFWSAGGKGAVGTYIADRQLVRFYIDGESSPSIEFEPAICGIQLKEPQENTLAALRFAAACYPRHGVHLVECALHRLDLCDEIVKRGVPLVQLVAILQVELLQRLRVLVAIAMYLFCVIKILDLLDEIAPSTRKVFEEVTEQLMSHAQSNWPVRKRNSKGSVNDFERGITVTSDSVYAYVRNNAQYAWAIKSGVDSVNRDKQPLIIPLGRRIAQEVLWSPARKEADRVAEALADDFAKRAK